MNYYTNLNFEMFIYTSNYENEPCMPVVGEFIGE